jgi:Fe-S-cluster-containing dehydrogenase component
MKAYYGYKDGSGTFYIIVDTDKCDGCGKCVDICRDRGDILELVENEFDPFEGGYMVAVKEEVKNKIKYVCAPCKPVGVEEPPPCIAVCDRGAIEHTW